MQGTSNVPALRGENKWEVDCGDLGTKTITEKQLEFILECQKQNIKLVRFEDFVINVSFIRGAKKVYIPHQLSSDEMYAPDGTIVKIGGGSNV